MKKYILVLLIALFAAALSGCNNGEPPSVPEVSGQTLIMPIECSVPESAEPTEETSESTESGHAYPVKNEAGYIKTTRNYNNEGELSNTETATFDGYGNEIENHSVYTDSEDERVIRERHFITEHDGSGRIFRESKYRIENGEEHPVSCSEYKYL